ncbi:hypothetical protein VaNZ11_007059 [Volvox africanus]|uniref:PIN domain-containing protein n=1 Tax=Volvox africanus TaxID=51714 RepID=A0ABQ5S2W2_9CHLO|nr:hypothetical protein VaNZ11_007059 [Volvox africanus]
METGTETDLYIPCKKVKEIVGTKEFLMLKRGANIMAPTAKPVDGEKGRRLVLDGPRESQAAAAFTVMLRLTPAEHHTSVSDPNHRSWHYISPAGNREGPFAARTLMVWLSKDQLPGSFHVQHGPSRVWMPLRLLARHYELLASGAEGAYAPMPWPFPLTCDADVVMTEVELDAEIAQLRQQPDFLGAIEEVVSMDVDSEGVAYHEWLIPGSLLAVTGSLHLPMPMDLDVMPGSGPPGSMAAQANRMRLYLVVDTNVLLRREGVELLQLIRRLFAPFPQNRIVPAAGHGRRSEEDSTRGSGGGSGRGSGGGRIDDRADRGSGDCAGFSCVAVIPWMVLAELDGLKGSWQGRRTFHKGNQNDDGDGKSSGKGSSGGGDTDYRDDDERPVAVMARSAVSLLLSALESGDGFFRGQTLQQFRVASTHPAAALPLGATSVGSDDRILQCCLHLQDDLSSKAAAAGFAYHVALLSNDNNLCVKTRICGIPATSVRQLLTHAALGSAETASWCPSPLVTPAPEPRQLEEALLRLAQQQPSTSVLEASSTTAPAASSGLQDSGGSSHEMHGPESQKAASTGSSSLGGGTTGWSDASVAGTLGSSGSATFSFNAWTAGGSNGQPWVAGADSNPAPRTIPDAPLLGQFDLDEVTDPMVAALHAELRRLTVVLAPVVRDIFVAEFKDLWMNVIVRPPPWSGPDMLEVLHRHLESVFSERLGNRVARPLRLVVETMVKHVRYYERGHGRPRRDANLVKVVEEFSRGVSDILRAFGEAPPPAPLIPAALLALRVGTAPPPMHGHGRCGGAVSGSMGRGMGGVMGTGMGGSMAGGDGSAVASGMQITAWNGNSDVYNSYCGGVATSAAPVIASRGSGGQSRTMAPAAARAAAVAQSIGLSVKLGNHEMRGGACAPPSPSTALSPVTSTAAAAGALSPVAASGAHGSAGAAGRRAGGNGTSAMAQQEHVVGLAGSADFEAKLMAAAAEPDGAVDSQVAKLLQHVMLMMQQAQQQQQQAQQQDLQGNHLQVVRAASESGHPVSAVQHQQALLLQQQLLQQQQLQHQAEQQRQVLVQRYYSDPAPAGDPIECTNSPGAAALASMKSAGSSVHLTQADVAARQLQLLQIKQQQQNVQTQSHEQMQQQQSQQATWQHMFAQRATANAEALQVQAQAQMQATSQAQVQHLSRASSGGGSILSPAGSMVSPGASVAPAPAWQTLLADAHQRQQLQQQQQQQQILLLHQAAAAAAAAAIEPVGGTVSSEATSSASVLDGSGSDPTPEVLALLRQTFFAHPQ